MNPNKVYLQLTLESTDKGGRTTAQSVEAKQLLEELIQPLLSDGWEIAGLVELGDVNYQ